MVKMRTLGWFVTFGFASTSLFAGHDRLSPQQRVILESRSAPAIAAEFSLDVYSQNRILSLASTEHISFDGMLLEDAPGGESKPKSR